MVTNPHHSFSLDFNCIDALKCLDPTHINMKVHNESMDVWSSTKYSVHTPYDWTFSTLYQGQIKGEIEEHLGGSIDYERLKTNKDVQFYDEVIMYDDELADNGMSIYIVKIRVMDFGWFILARHFLRVEKVCMKAREVRYYHEFGQATVMKELRVREKCDSCQDKKTIDELVAELSITECQTFCIELMA